MSTLHLDLTDEAPGDIQGVLASFAQAAKENPLLEISVNVNADGFLELLSGERQEVTPTPSTVTIKVDPSEDDLSKSQAVEGAEPVKRRSKAERDAGLSPLQAGQFRASDFGTPEEWLQATGEQPADLPDQEEAPAPAEQPADLPDQEDAAQSVEVEEVDYDTLKALVLEVATKLKLRDEALRIAKEVFDVASYTGLTTREQWGQAYALLTILKDTKAYPSDDAIAQVIGL